MRRFLRRIFDPFDSGWIDRDPSLHDHDREKSGGYQVYSIRRGRIHEAIVLEKRALRKRSSTLRNWLRPILPELEGSTFCVHLEDQPGSTLVEGIPNLCYCKRIDDERDLELVPDTHYQLYSGYNAEREYRRLYASRWNDKIPKAIFRGSCTGARNLEHNLRAQLCRLNHPLIDARISRVNNGWTKQELAGLFGKEMSVYRMARYKYQIDIDGNACSWCAFFWKLMSGSLTFKMRSPWRQWYYGDIGSGRHYVEFGDFDELIDLLRHYQNNDESAFSIAGNARNFTRSFQEKDQQALFVRQATGRCQCT